MPRIIKKESTKKQKAITYVTGIGASVLFIIILILCLGKGLGETFEILGDMFVGMKMFRNVLNLAVPLTIAALGLAVCYKMKFYNIGGEGQIIAGAVAACAVARVMEGKNQFLTLAIMFICALIAGGIFSLITGLLKVYFNANEVIITLMFNYIALVFAELLQSTYWREGAFVSVRSLTDNARLSNLPISLMLIIFLIEMLIYNIIKYLRAKKIKLFSREHKKFPFDVKHTVTFSLLIVLSILCLIVIPNKLEASVALFFLLVVYIVVDIFLTQTKKGFEIAVIGESTNTAIYSGMSVGKTTIIVTFVSGAILGLAGFIKLAGINYQFSPSITSGIGFTAVIIAWLANLKNGRIVVIGFMYAFLYQGIKFVETSGVNTSAADIILGMILFVALTCEFFNRYKIVGGTKDA
ncbi:MAG: hypothetical protein WCS56_00555 [Bacilli bacterium]